MFNVILADDHLIIRQAIGQLLESSGKYRVVAHVSNGKELITTVERKPADILIVDIAMPDMGGVEAVKKLRDKDIGIPVLALSANDDSKSIKAILVAGANGFVPKNSSLEELDFAISSVLRGNAYLSPSVTEKMMNSGQCLRSSDNILSQLTTRELEVLQHLAEGRPNRDIGRILHISTRTVDTHRSNILKKLSLKTNAELVRLAISEGLISVG